MTAGPRFDSYLARGDHRLAAVTILLAFVIIVMVAANAGWALHPGGPLQSVIQNTSQVTLRYPIGDGEALTWGMALPRNPTLTEMTIWSVEPVGIHGVEVLGVLLSYPVLKPNGMCASIGLVTGFPPAATPTREVRGAVLPTTDRMTCEDQPTVFVGVRRMTHSLDGTVDAMRLLYMQQGTRYEVILPFRLEVTQPQSGKGTFGGPL